MRQDQYERLQSLSEELADVFVVEATPANWPGANTPPAEMTKDQRGDRYWVKKNAFATISLIHRIGNLVTLIQDNSNAGRGGAEVQEGERLLDEEVAAAEAEGKRLLSQTLRNAGKPEFDKRVHGKS